MLRLSFLYIAVMSFCSAYSQNIGENKNAVDSMRDYLAIPFKLRHENIKSLQVILTRDSILLNGINIEDVDYLLTALDTQFRTAYSINHKLDSVIALQIYFGTTLPKEEFDAMYSGIERLYNESWERISQQTFNKPYSGLNNSEIGEVKRLAPFYVNWYELILLEETDKRR